MTIFFIFIIATTSPELGCTQTNPSRSSSSSSVLDVDDDLLSSVDWLCLHFWPKFVGYISIFVFGWKISFEDSSFAKDITFTNICIFIWGPGKSGEGGVAFSWNVSCIICLRGSNQQTSGWRQSYRFQKVCLSLRYNFLPRCPTRRTNRHVRVYFPGPIARCFNPLLHLVSYINFSSAFSNVTIKSSHAVKG